MPWTQRTGVNIADNLPVFQGHYIGISLQSSGNTRPEFFYCRNVVFGSNRRIEHIRFVNRTNRLRIFRSGKAKGYFIFHGMHILSCPGRTLPVSGSFSSFFLSSMEKNTHSVFLRCISICYADRLRQGFRPALWPVLFSCILPFSLEKNESSFL